jgi:hypothetical protein
MKSEVDRFVIERGLVVGCSWVFASKVLGAWLACLRMIHFR